MKEDNLFLNLERRPRQVQEKRPLLMGLSLRLIIKYMMLSTKKNILKGI